MVHCAPTKEEAYAVAEESFVWYPKTGAALDRVGRGVDGGAEAGARHLRVRRRRARRTSATARSASSTFDYIHDAGAGVVGDPDECIETCKRYEAAGCDLLLCLVNPYNIPHEKVMQSIELLGKHVIPEFAVRPAPDGAVR